MSIRHAWGRLCRDRAVYSSRDEAAESAVRLTRADGHTGWVPYRCVACALRGREGWHLRRDDGRAAQRRPTSWGPLFVVLVLLLTGCSSGPAAPTADGPRWEPVSVPHPDGTRLMLRDVADCEGEPMLAGAVEEDGTTRPGAWYGDPLMRVVTSGGDLYAHQAVVSTSACRDGTVVLLGSKTGGAHGLPRTSTFVGSTRSVRNVRAPFEVFGGPDQLWVRRFAVGDPGFRLVGARTAGAAVWTSPDGRRFTLREHEPGLASGADEQTAARDSVFFDRHWLVVGNVDDRATVFREDGSRWHRTYLTHSGGYATAERVTTVGDHLVAVGLDGRRFAAWTSTDGTSWRLDSHFGALPDGGTGAPYVSGLAAVPGGVVVAVSDGESYRLFCLADAWSELEPPTSLPSSSGDHAVTVGSVGQRLFLVVDDGEASRLWVASTT